MHFNFKERKIKPLDEKYSPTFFFFFRPQQYIYFKAANTFLLTFLDPFHIPIQSLLGK